MNKLCLLETDLSRNLIKRLTFWWKRCCPSWNSFLAMLNNLLDSIVSWNYGGEKTLNNNSSVVQQTTDYKPTTHYLFIYLFIYWCLPASFCKKMNEASKWRNPHLVFFFHLTFFLKLWAKWMQPTSMNSLSCLYRLSSCSWSVSLHSCEWERGT